MIFDHDSGVIWSNGANPNMPAHVTSTNIASSALRALAKACSTPARSETSAPSAIAVVPAARRSSVTRWAACSLTSSTPTLCLDAKVLTGAALSIVVRYGG